jgi:hypothetical protein
MAAKLCYNNNIIDTSQIVEDDTYNIIPILIRNHNNIIILDTKHINSSDDQYPKNLNHKYKCRIVPQAFANNHDFKMSHALYYSEIIVPSFVTKGKSVDLYPMSSFL